MSLTATLKVNSSPVEKIGKTLTAGTDFSVTLKENTSILKPVLFLKSTSSLVNYNYMYISDFNRYYFIDDIRSVRNDLWEISAHVDVLETYKTNILLNTAVIRRQENQYNLYLDDPEFKAYNYDLIQTLQFKGGANPFSKTLSYVLTVNGSYEPPSKKGGDEDVKPGN